jgi:hypothetical protein
LKARGYYHGGEGSSFAKSANTIGESGDYHRMSHIFEKISTLKSV